MIQSNAVMYKSNLRGQKLEFTINDLWNMINCLTNK